MSDMVGPRSPPSVPYRTPSFGLAEAFVILTRGLRPGHWAFPTNQSRNCPSSLRLIS
jgi:hypothetical protein